MPNSHSLFSLSKKLLPATRLTQPTHHSTFPELTAIIANLQLHPTIEATLHMLNADLPSAHFLLRHMQAPPAVEGMLLHGILHRVEGDFSNSRLWISDVSDACSGYIPKKKASGEKLDDDVFSQTQSPKHADSTLLSHVYASHGAAGQLIDDVEAWRKEKDGDQGELEDRARGELERVLGWCRDKFGDGVWEDATGAWVRNSEEIRGIGEGMVSGGKGWREF